MRRFVAVIALSLCLIPLACSQEPTPPEPPEPPEDPEAPKTPQNSGQNASNSGTTTQPAPAPDEPAVSATGVKFDDWKDPLDRPEPFDLNFAMLDQDGREVNLADFVGKPMAVSFIFTRCPDPKMCPLITLRMADLQDQLRKLGILDDVQLLLISYDPRYDTPERLKAYAKDRGMEFESMAMLTARDPALLPLLLEHMGVTAEGQGASFKHLIELLLIDRGGRFVRAYYGRVWENDPVIEDLKRLIDE